MSESITIHATEGIRHMAANPDWPHECCYPGDCNHRASLDGIKRCESPAECEWFCEVKR